MHMRVSLSWFIVFLLLAGCGWKKLEAKKEVQPADAKSPPPCPEVGSAVDLACSPGQVKLLSAEYYRMIGDKEQVSSGSGRVFGVVQLEWIVDEAQSAPPPRPELVDGNGSVWSAHKPGLAAFLSMQPEGRFMDRSVEFQGKLVEAVVYEFPTSAAPSGLFLVLPESCEARVEPARFCLGKRKIR